jgi:multiphosphoryl transfer protein
MATIMVCQAPAASYTPAPTVQLSLKAPLSGPLVALADVPDPVFAARMVGDGIAIDPVTNELRAPCDAVVRRLHPALHAITLEAAGGIEVLMHIGLETVGLKGDGFKAHVKDGDRVKTGDVLVEFDADRLADRAKSLLTEIVITNGDRVASFGQRAGYVRAAEDVVLDLTLAAAAPPAAAAASAGQDALIGEDVVVPNPEGLHARPAAVLACAAKGFEADVQLRRGSASANARSVVGLMSLEVAKNDVVRVVARGKQAREAVDALSRLIREGLGEGAGATPAAVTAPAAPASGTSTAVPVASADPNRVVGVPASPGLAIGQVFPFRAEDGPVPERGGEPHEERRALEEALARARSQLQALEARLRGEADPAKAAIFAAHVEILDDPDLREPVERAIGEGASAAFAWREAYTDQARRLGALRSELLAARATDVRDVGGRVLRLLTGAETGPRAFPADSIVVAEDLTPSDTASLDRTKVIGFCTTTGGSSSHVAILARSMGLPAIAGIEARALDIPAGTRAILDGARGSLRLRPSDAEVAQIRGRQERVARRRAAALAATHQEASTADGHRVEVAANITGPDDAREAMRLGAEGIGLLRSEFLFLDRSTAPSEAEQLEAYEGIAKAVGHDRPLVIRTLDVGGDKPLAYLPIPREDNPFLGERGIRVSLDRPEIFRAQLRAILGAAPSGRVHVMFPMIATLTELRRARAILEEERQRLSAGPIPVGIMVEVAAVAVLADVFAPEVDFFSIGTNDLTQYTLAMDRGHPRLAPQVDALNPAVLRLIDTTVRAAHKHGRWVGVCGGIAGDPQAVPILIGLGVDELSVSVPVVPEIKARVRELRFPDCQALAAKALAAGTAEEVRKLSPEPTE